MSILYMLQFACCIVTAMLAFMLVFSRLQVRWVNPTTERTRWLICAAMVILSLHYMLQMQFGFRAQGDDVGTTINILFYSPSAVLISLGIINAECVGVVRRRYFLVGILGQLLIFATFAVGWLRAGSLHIGDTLYVLLGLFMFLLVFFIYSDLREAHRRRKIIEEETAADLLPYDRYTLSSLLLLCASSLMLFFSLLYLPVLMVLAPLMLLALFVFSMSFIALTYNVVPIDSIFDVQSGEEDDADGRPVDTLQKALADVGVQQSFTEARATEISHRLSEWCESGGYRDPAVNMSSLSRRIKVSRQELTVFFDRNLQSSFRLWLSEVRFQAAKRMLGENAHYSNEAISVECGFSSHAHLYKVFRNKTGMTPKMYKEALAAKPTEPSA